MVDVAREHVVDLEAVARKLGVSLQTVRNWSKPHLRRRLETVRVGRLVRTSWEAVQRFSVPADEESSVVQTKQATQAHEDACALLRAEGFVF